MIMSDTGSRTVSAKESLHLSRKRRYNVSKLTSKDWHAGEVGSRLFQWIKPGKSYKAFLKNARR